MTDTGSPAAGYMRDSIDLFWRKSVSRLLTDILICHFYTCHLHLTFYQTFRSVIFISHLYLSYSVIVFCSLLCHSLYCHLFCHLPTSSYYVVCFCRVPQSFASVIFTWHSEPVIYNPFVIAFCHCLVPFSCHVLL